MQDDESLLAIRVTSTPDPIAVIKSLRAATGLSLHDIKTAVADGVPVAIARMFGLDHDEKQRLAIALFDDLDRTGATFEIHFEGIAASREYFLNVMQHWRDICDETRAMTDLEIGEPNIQTLEWLKAHGSPEVFRDTLRLVVNSEDYLVDAKTLEWAKRELQGITAFPPNPETRHAKDSPPPPIDP